MKTAELPAELIYLFKKSGILLIESRLDPMMSVRGTLTSMSMGGPRPSRRMM